MFSARRTLPSLAVLVGCGLPLRLGAQGIAHPAPGSELQELIEGWRADQGALERRHAVVMSGQRHAQLSRLHTGWRERLAEIDFDQLSRAGQVDWLLFDNHLRRELAQLEESAARDAAVGTLLPWTKLVVELLEAREGVAPIEPTEVAQRLEEWSAAVTQSLAALAHTPPAATPARLAQQRVGRLRRRFEEWFTFRDGYDPAFSWWVRKPYQALAAKLESCEQQLRKCIGEAPDGGEPLVGDPIGVPALLAALAFEFIPYTPAELVAIAEREFAWCDAEFDKAAAELGFAGDWRKAQEHVKGLHVAPGKQPELILQLAAEAEAFLREHDLITIPPLASATWRMEMMAPARQLVNPFFLGGECIIVSFPTDAMAHKDKLQSLRGNNIHFCRATVHHELIPGHHLQQFMQARHRPYRQTFETPFWIEGWALYWEMLLYELGFPKTAADRVGMLFWRKHRCARIVFSLRFHMGEWNAAQCIAYLVERVGHEPNSATAEVRRSIIGGYSPLYQAAYMLGGLQLRALRQQLVASGQMSLRAFHDAILRENSMPIEMLRAAMTDVKLSREYATNWRFDDAK
jgi:uncharacterized protein (DUF885 family)